MKKSRIISGNTILDVILIITSAILSAITRIITLKEI